MRLEVDSAADFLMNLLRIRHANSLHENQLQHFKGSLQQLLVLQFRSHWYPDIPAKGSGYRCIRINGKMDPLVEQAGSDAGLLPQELSTMLPPELTLWIDPEEVAYRIGENGSICVLYNSQNCQSPLNNWDSNGTSTGTGTTNKVLIMERVGHSKVADIRLIEYLENKSTKKTTPNSSLHSIGSDDSQLSPPLSPPIQFNNNNRVQQYQAIYRGVRRIGRQSFHHPMNYVESNNMYNGWDGFSHTNNNNISKAHFNELIRLVDSNKQLPW